MGNSDSDSNAPPTSGQGVPPEKSRAIAGDVALERFAKSFEASARRWELIVYPSLFAFIILAAYGFFLIYSLTEDMHTLAKRMDPEMGANMGTMADHISVLSLNIENMSDRIDTMTGYVKVMAGEITELNGYVAVMEKQMVQMTGHTESMSTKLNTLEPMLLNIASMNSSMRVMTTNTGVMSYDVNQMQRPMSFMNQFFPW